MASEQETVADIVAELRTVAEYHYLAGRLEAAWKREHGAAWNEGYDQAKRDFRPIADELERLRNTPIGNAAAMREALETAQCALKSAEKYVYGNPPNGGALGWNDVWPSEWHNALKAVERALAAPPRNCDVGTAEEQSKRFHSYCVEHNSACDVDMECCRCPLEKVETRCEFAWAQLPYEAQEGGAK